MRNIVIPFIIMLLISACGQRMVLRTEAPQAVQPASHCIIGGSDTLTEGIHLDIRDIETNEPIDYCLVTLLDSAGTKAVTGYFSAAITNTVLPMPADTFSLRFSFPGYFPLLLKNIPAKKQYGYRLTVLLRPDSSLINCCDCDPWEPAQLNPLDRFSPLNITITRETFLRIPK